MKKFILLSLFIATSSYAQVGVGSLNEKSIYDIGTGFSMSYFDSSLDSYMAINVESLHFFRNLDRPFDNAFLKVGMGANVKTTDNDTTVGTGNTGNTGDDRKTGFNFLTSIGYLYVQDQYHEKSVLNKFGTGATVDYSLIMTEKENHGIGVTLYVVVNGFFIGIGGGAIVPSDVSDEEVKATPYVNASFAIAF